MPTAPYLGLSPVESYRIWVEVLTIPSPQPPSGFLSATIISRLAMEKPPPLCILRRAVSPKYHVGDEARHLAQPIAAMAAFTCQHRACRSNAGELLMGPTWQGHSARKESHTCKMGARGQAHYSNPLKSQKYSWTEIIVALSFLSFSLFVNSSLVLGSTP